ncbi:MAG: transglutaminase family protein [Alphaproteobacteria bacterium]|nr:transglutaminase family protein [Alphaproteobacteria bacterium]
MTPTDYLKKLGERGDGPHDIAYAALMLAALDHPGEPIERPLSHLVEISDAMKKEASMIRRVNDGARTVAALLASRLGYDGDRLDYNNAGNADLITVIARRRGLPVALGILYMHAARALGLRAEGLNTQGHFVIRLTHRHDDITIDPFNGGAVVDRDHMPAELKGHDVGLAQTVSDTDVLLRLENNLKMRALDAGKPERALEVTSRMVLIAPRRPELWFDLARLNEATGVLGAARKAYESCLALTPAGQPLYNEASLSLAQLKRRLN